MILATEAQKKFMETQTCIKCRKDNISVALYYWNDENDQEHEGLLCAGCASFKELEGGCTCIDCEAAQDNGHAACSLHFGDMVDCAHEVFKDRTNL